MQGVKNGVRASWPTPLRQSTLPVIPSRRHLKSKAGEIVGFHGATVNTEFMLTLPSSFTTVLPPGAKQSQLVGINNIKNTSVGFYIDGNGVTHGFIDAAEIIATQDEPGTNFNQLLGINDAGQEAGYSSMDTAGLVDQLAYLRQANGTYTLIDNATHTADLPTNVNSQATGVDDAGDVVEFLCRPWPHRMVFS